MPTIPPTGRAIGPQGPQDEFDDENELPPEELMPSNLSTETNRQAGTHDYTGPVLAGLTKAARDANRG